MLHRLAAAARTKTGRLLLCGLLAAATVTALAFPAAFYGGQAIKQITGDDALPAALSAAWTQKTTYVYANDGRTLITAFYDENRRDVALSDMAPVIQQAIVASEDIRYFHHGGVDLRSVARALVANNRSGGVQQGASTLTMQYVRNVFKEDPNLNPVQQLEVTADTAKRKIQEMRYAMAVDKILSKEEILRRYLNIAYFGAGAYGIDAAAHRYFSKPPSQLSLDEAALLAGIVQSPDVYNPISGDRVAALGRRAYVLDSMVTMKAITPDQAQAAKGMPLRLHPSEPPNNCMAVPDGHNDWGFFCDYFRRWWDTQPAFGASPAERDDNLNQGGYRIITTLDPGVQAIAVKQSLTVYDYNDRHALPLAVVEPGTGRVLALAVNRHYSLEANPRGRTYPNTVNQLIAGGGDITGYQAGSTFKMFTMLAALEAGKPLDTSFNSASPLVTHWPGSGSDVGACHNRWCPVNDNPAWMAGEHTMWSGFGRSVNTYFVHLEEQIGAARAVAMAVRLGITFRADSDAAMATKRASDWGSFTLGVSDTTPLDLANAYATVAADGVYCQARPVQSITDSDGKALSVADPQCRQAVQPDLARAAADAARCPVGQESVYNECDGATAGSVAGILAGRPVGGKTGSSERNATETFVGFTPQLSAAAIAANPDSTSDAVGAAVSDSVDAAVAHTLADALSGQPARQFPAPSKTIAGLAG
jgi:membrane peptidoglycan carboxypeptidase